VNAVMPDMTVFPYVIRVCRKSSSTTVDAPWRACAAPSLSLMDAGVRSRRRLAGRHGLVLEAAVTSAHESSATRSLGDMDFKVAGTKDG